MRALGRPAVLARALERAERPAGERREGLAGEIAALGQDEGVVSLGMSQEICNAPRGYRVILQHPANMPGAAIISDHDRIPLSDSGETILSNSDHPGIRLRQLALDVGNDPAQLSHLGIRIEVKY